MWGITPADGEQKPKTAPKMAASLSSAQDAARRGYLTTPVKPVVTLLFQFSQVWFGRGASSAEGRCPTGPTNMKKIKKNISGAVAAVGHPPVQQLPLLPACHLPLALLSVLSGRRLSEQGPHGP